MVKKIISKKDLRKIKHILRPIVFVPMAADLLHHGHIRILRKSSKFGSIIVGLMTNIGLKKYKGSPVINYKQRKEIILELKSVDYVIPINGLLYVEIAKILKPEYFVHGKDWREGPQKKIRKKLIDTMHQWNGKVVEFPYTKGISSSNLKRKLQLSKYL